MRRVTGSGDQPAQPPAPPGRALDLRDSGLTWRAVAEALTVEGHATRGGGPWHPATAQRAARTVALDREADQAPPPRPRRSGPAMSTSPVQAVADLMAQYGVSSAVAEFIAAASPRLLGETGGHSVYRIEFDDGAAYVGITGGLSQAPPGCRDGGGAWCANRSPRP